MKRGRDEIPPDCPNEFFEYSDCCYLAAGGLCVGNIVVDTERLRSASPHGGNQLFDCTKKAMKQC